MIDNPFLVIVPLVPSVSAGTLMLAQPEFKHPMGQSLIESLRYALNEGD